MHSFFSDAVNYLTDTFNTAYPHTLNFRSCIILYDLHHRYLPHHRLPDIYYVCLPCFPCVGTKIQKVSDALRNIKNRILTTIVL